MEALTVKPWQSDPKAHPWPCSTVLPSLIDYELTETFLGLVQFNSLQNAQHNALGIICAQ